MAAGSSIPDPGAVVAAGSGIPDAGATVAAGSGSVVSGMELPFGLLGQGYTLTQSSSPLRCPSCELWLKARAGPTALLTPGVLHPP